MKASELIVDLKKLIDKHGDLDVQGEFKTGRVTTFGSCKVDFAESINYATPEPYKKTPYIYVGHIDFEKEKTNG